MMVRMGRCRGGHSCRAFHGSCSELRQVTLNVPRLPTVVWNEPRVSLPIVGVNELVIC